MQPELAIVEKEQVDSALLSAIIDTAFVFLDGAGAIAGGGRSARAGKALLEAAEEGAEASAEVLAKSSPRTRRASRRSRRSVGEIGAAEVSRISGKSYAELAEIAAARRRRPARSCSRWPSSGPRRAAKAAADAASKLPNLARRDRGGEITKEEANKIALDAIGHLGHVGRDQGRRRLEEAARGGRRQARPGRRSRAGASAILKELEEFVARETEEATKAVRTGTKGPTSDLDIQAVGGEASLMADKANKWLAARVGCGEEELKTVLDATVFVDPTRAHLLRRREGPRPGRPRGDHGQAGRLRQAVHLRCAPARGAGEGRPGGGRADHRRGRRRWA